MRTKIQLFVIATIIVGVPSKLKAKKVILLAGAILQCRLSNPNLPSKTAQLGEPSCPTPGHCTGLVSRCLLAAPI